MNSFFRFVCTLILLIPLAVDANVPDSDAKIVQPLSDRIESIHTETNRLISKKDTNAIESAKYALQLAEEENNPEIELVCMNMLAETYGEFFNYDSSLAMLSEAVSIHEQVQDGQLKGKTFELLGKTHLFVANYDSAEYYLRKSEQVYKDAETNKLENEARLKTLIGLVWRYKGDFDRAMEEFYEALAYYEAVSDSAQIYKVQQNIGIVTFLQRDFKRALELVSRTSDYYERVSDTAELSLSQTIIGLIYFREKEYDLSIEYSLKSIALRQAINDIRGLGESYNNIALAYMGKKEWKQALGFLSKSVEALTAGNDLREIPVILGNIGDCYRNMEMSSKALEFYNKGLQKSRDSRAKHHLYYLLRKISGLHAENGNYKDAYIYYRKYAAAKDSVFSAQKAKTIAELEIKYEKEKDNKQIALLQKDKQIDENRKLGLTIGLILLVIILGLSILLFWTRMRKNRMLFTREKQILEAREALTESELRNARNELAYNKNRMVVYMENVLEKNKFISELESRLEELSISDEAENLKRKAKLNELLELKILTDEDWLTFKNHFVQAYPGYLVKLNETYPNLTTGETRLFLLLRLGLASREISNILGVSPETVKKGRYRLRKKLDLPEEKSLDEFVKNFL